MPPRRAALAAAVLMLAVVLLWQAVRAGWTDPLDRSLLRIVSAAVPAELAGGVTRLGDTIVRFALAAAGTVGLLVAGRRRGAAFLWIAVLAGAGFNELLKQVAARARPDLLPALEIAHGTSFPSGHAAGAIVLFGAAALLVSDRHRRLASTIAMALALAVGLSRVALAVHWPSDVLAGWLAGAAWLVACAALFSVPALPGSVRRSTGTPRPPAAPPH